jgi:hypothetical protein
VGGNTIEEPVDQNAPLGVLTCYATGTVDGNDFVGGLVGYHDDGSYDKCFWDSDINPDANGIGN